MLSLKLWRELARWRRAGRTARLWWRDDDAAGGSARLDRLLQLSWDRGVPLTLAVVPAGDMVSLGARLADTTLVSVTQHGVDHQNRRGGPAAGEFPHDWTQGDLEIALRRGWSLIQGLPRAEAIYVPPWNDAHPALEAALAACGYAGWSVNGEMAPAGADPGEHLPRVDAHLDLMRWRGGARFRGRGRFLRTLAGELARRRKAGLWSAPIGILTHHLAHDERAWRFLEAFLTWSLRRPEFAWAALPDLLRAAGEGHETTVRPLAPRGPELALAAARNPADAARASAPLSAC
jgi:hypothetical protein